MLRHRCKMDRNEGDPIHIPHFNFLEQNGLGQLKESFYKHRGHGGRCITRLGCIVSFSILEFADGLFWKVVCVGGYGQDRLSFRQFVCKYQME